MAGLTEIELAEKTGTTPEEIRILIESGILTPGDDQAAFTTRDVARVRLAMTLRDSGIQIDAVRDAIAAGHLSFAFMDAQTYEWSGLSATTYAKAAADLGLSLDLLQRLHEALGFVEPGPEDLVREDDLEMFPALMAIQGSGLSDAQMARALRVYGENLRRVAQAEAQFYHAYIETPLLASGMTERDMRALASQVSLLLGPLVERMILWLYRRHQEHYIVEDLVEHVEAAMERAGVAPRRLQKPPAMVFLDLTGYTRLTEERGDETAAELAATLAGLVHRVSRQHGGHPVKWLGDGVMFHFPDPAESVRSALDMVRQVPDAGLPPAHVGVNAGPVVLRDGDYFGRTVNLAARIAAVAKPGQVLVSDAVATGARPEGVRFVEVGAVELKGVSAPVMLHAAERAE